MWESALGSTTDLGEPTDQLNDDVILPIHKLDDEITSVVASGSSIPLHPAKHDGSVPDQTEDIVVGEASLVPELRDQIAPRQRQETLDDGVNIGAHEDQAIRLEIMARGGNQDALQQARERLRKRRMVTLKLPANPAAVLSDNDSTPATPMEQVMDPDVDSRKVTSFDPLANRRPDDETQPPQVGTRLPETRSPMRAYNDPMPPVPADRVKPGPVAKPKTRQDQDLFDSVPEVDPDFELPLMDSATHQQEFQNADKFTGEDILLPEERLSSYDLVLQRARAIRAATRPGYAQGQAGSSRPPQASREMNPPPPVPAPVKAATPAPAIVRHQPAARNEQPVRNERREAFALAEESSFAHPVSESPVRRAPKTKSRSRFDVSMLISRGISFYRPEPAAQEVEKTQKPSSVADWNDEYDSIEEPIAPVQRRPAFYRPDDSYAETAVDTEDSESELYLDSTEEAQGAPAVVKDNDANDSLYYDEDGDTFDPEYASFEHQAEEHAKSPMPDLHFDTPRNAHSDSSKGVRQRDLYRSGQDDDVVDTPRRVFDTHPNREFAPPRTQRSDYRIRSTFVEENVHTESAEEYDDANPAVAPSASDQLTWSAPEAKSNAPVPVNAWSFEPQENLDLRQDSGMDAFRARLFNKALHSPRATAHRVSQSESESDSFARKSFNEDRIQRLQARSIDIPTSSPQHSPLRSSSFDRGEQPDQSSPSSDEQFSTQHEVQCDERTPSTHHFMERNSTFDLRDVLDHQGDMLDMTLTLAPELPRSCRTCRDFRPSESGERGWCNNAWAFTHSQMVDADDLACQSTIGCWWTPYDEVWLPEERETAPTPRVAQMVTDSGARKRSG